MSNLKYVTDPELGRYKLRELELEEEMDSYRCCEEKRGLLKLVRLESGADTAVNRGTVPWWCGAPQGSVAIAAGLSLDG